MIEDVLGFLDVNVLRLLSGETLVYFYGDFNGDLFTLSKINKLGLFDGDEVRFVEVYVPGFFTDT